MFGESECFMAQSLKILTWSLMATTDILFIRIPDIRVRMPDTTLQIYILNIPSDFFLLSGAESHHKCLHFLLYF